MRRESREVGRTKAKLEEREEMYVDSKNREMTTEVQIL